MEYTNEVLKDMEKDKTKYNTVFARFYQRRFRESGGIVRSKMIDGKKHLFGDGGTMTFYNKAERILSCCDLWAWDKYERNKLLDLQRLNRCKNNRFCPNCKKMHTAKFIHEVKQKLPLLEDYDFYLLTLTVPSEHMTGEELSEFISRLYLTFQRLNRKFSAELLSPSGRPSSQALQERFLVFAGGVRVLEITYGTAGFHPHLHCLVVVKKDSIAVQHLEKRYKGKWSRKRNGYNPKSDIDLQIGKAWTMLWYGVNFRKWDNVDYFCKDVYLQIDGVPTEHKNLEVDFKPMDEDGLFEVIKYTFKSDDVSTYPVFCVLDDGLAYKRIRQGFGIMHDLKCEDDCDGEKQPLILEHEEEPESILTREFRELLEKYSEYRKISRFNPAEKDVVTRLSEME